MKITKTDFLSYGWARYPCYHVRTQTEYDEIMGWCNQSQIETFLLATGTAGYVFQVKDNQSWFDLRWL